VAIDESMEIRSRVNKGCEKWEIRLDSIAQKVNDAIVVCIKLKTTGCVPGARFIQDA
jgi:hypothetical protein